MGKLDKLKGAGEKLKNIKVKTPDVSKVIRIHAKPDRYAIWTAKAVAFMLTPPRQRRMMGQDVVEMQYAFLKGVIDSESWREKCSELGFRERFEKMEAKLLPGIMAHCVLRKRRIEEHVRREIGKGCNQIVSFGPGYDTLLPRIAEEFPHVQCIEADLLSTQRAKVSTLRTRPRNLHFVDINLNEPYLERVMMESTPFNKRERTFFIAEGLLMWLEDDDVERLMAFMQDHGALGSKLAFTFLERGTDHRAFFPEVGFFTDAFLRLYKVQFGWGVRIEHVSRYLNDRYFGLIEMESPSELRTRYGADIKETLKPLKKHPVGDYLGYAELVFIDESPTGTGPNQRKFV